jgi:PAS domain S-box-containing protein
MAVLPTDAAVEAPVPAAAPDRDAVYRALFEHAVNAMALHRIVLDDAGRPVDYVFLDANAAFEKLTGLDRAAVVGRRVTEVLPGIEDDPADWIGRYGRIAMLGESARFEQLSAPLQRWYDVAAFSPARGYFAVVFSETTEHKRREEALREREAVSRLESAELSAILNATHAQLALLDDALRIVMVNDAYERACGHPRAALIGRGHFELFPNDENERIFRRVAETGEPFYVDEKPFVFADQPARGVTYWSWSLVPVVREGGRVRRMLLSLLDVTGQVTARVALEQLAAERKRSEEAARESEAQSRESDRRKSEFLSVLSHELRNPLAPIRNAIYLLERTPAGGPQAGRALEVLRRQSEHLTRLVDDLLDLTRISRGKIKLERSRVDLRDLVRRTCEDHASLYEEAALRLACDLPDRPVWIDADPTRICQVLGNLLQNAAKFTPAGGSVQVTAAAPAGRAELCVRDDGIGIEPGEVERMFEPFTQADQSLARTRGGLGLGLALVKGIVELHGGRITARSEGHGLGSRFCVSIPLAPDAGPAPREG